MGNSITLLDEQNEWVAEQKFDKSPLDNEVMVYVRNALKLKRVFYHDGSGKETFIELKIATIKEAIHELTGMGPWSTSSLVQGRVGEISSFLTTCIEYSSEHGLDILHFKFM
nr:hypothetical protein [Candidatus Sigynarchaeota archaeon]